jgi:hypothetical protein
VALVKEKLGELPMTATDVENAKRTGPDQTEKLTHARLLNVQEVSPTSPFKPSAVPIAGRVNIRRKGVVRHVAHRYWGHRLSALVP